MSMPVGFRSLMVLGLLFASSSAWAQNREGWRAPQGGWASLRETSVTGTIEGVQSAPGVQGIINVKNATGHPYMIAVLPASKLGVTGTAKPDYLKPGMMVSFTADVDVKKGAISEPLKELAIITKSETNTPGLFPEDRENKESTRFFIRGIVKTFKDGTLTVTAGKPLTAQVTSDAAIKLESTDLSIVRQGDEIAVDGRLYQDYRSENNQVRPGQVIGEKIDIKLAEPLSADSFKKKPGVKPKTAG